MDNSLYNLFYDIVSYTSPKIQHSLRLLSKDTINKIQEIRIRVNRPIVITTNSGCSFLNKTGKLSYIISSNCIIPNENDINDSINKMCDYSMHSHYEDILNGYITLPNGSRVGITGTAIYDKEKVIGIKDFDGINIRIPRRIMGVSNILFKTVFKNGPVGLLVVGPPSSGKTTMLKDITYQFSSGTLGKYYKICVIDERKEIVNYKRDYCTIGPNTDVLYGFPKSIGISMAVRTLSPDIIICDEVGSNEIESIIDVMNTGVHFVLTVHAKNNEELIKKKFYKQIIKHKCVNYIAFLKENNEPCTISDIIEIDGETNETNNYNFNNNIEHSNCNQLYKKNKVAY